MDVAVLNDLNLDVNPGEIVVLVGPSGCGKTTILNLLSGHIEPVSGSIVTRRNHSHRISAGWTFSMAYGFGKYFYGLAFN